MFLTSWLRPVQNRLAWSRWLRRNRRRSQNETPNQTLRKQAELLEQRTLLTTPDFVSVSPNVGTFLQDGDVRTDAPQELVFQISPGQTLDTATLGAISITAAGGTMPSAPRPRSPTLGRVARPWYVWELSGWARAKTALS